MCILSCCSILAYHSLRTGEIVSRVLLLRELSGETYEGSAKYGGSECRESHDEKCQELERKSARAGRGALLEQEMEVAYKLHRADDSNPEWNSWDMISPILPIVRQNILLIDFAHCDSWLDSDG